MPRRKKKSIDAKKVPLEFTESPFSGTFHPPSPVFCSDNPATADVVAINEDLQFPWVSPQFSRPPASLTRTKKTRRSKRLANKTVDVNSTSIVTPNHKSRKKINHKFVPLRFEGERTPEPPSMIEEVTFDENTPPAPQFLSTYEKDKLSAKKLNPNPGICVECEKSKRQHGSYCDRHRREKNSNLDATNLYSTHKNHKGISLENHRDSSDHSNGEDNENNDLNHVPVTKTKTGRKPSVRRKRMKSARLKIDLEGLFSDDSDVSLLAARGSDKENGVNTCDSDSVSGEMRAKSKELQTMAPGSPGQAKVRDTTNCDDNQAVGALRTDTPPRFADEDSMTSLRLNLSTPTTTNTVSSENIKQLTDNKGVYGSFVTPNRQRRSLRLLNMFLPSTPTQTADVKEKYQVLAYDTPEEDYGLPVRKRYLKGMKLLKMKRLEQLK